MARSEHDPTHEPPHSSSEEEEEEEEEEGEEVEESDEEEEEEEGSESESEPEEKTSTLPFTPLTAAKNASSASSKKAQPELGSSTDESDSETESDGDPPPKKLAKADPNIKPLASKPMDEDSPRKPRSKNPTVRYSPPPPSRSAAGGGKRAAPAPESGAKDLKRAKKGAIVAVPAPDAALNAGKKQLLLRDAESAGKKHLFQRVWSEDDEVELINGMISYVEKKKKDPIADVGDFYDFIKKSLHVEVNTKQMLTKLRRLRRKFVKNAGKEEENRKVRSFSKPHEIKLYELSKKVWGNGSSSKSRVRSRTKANVTPKKNEIGGNGKGKAIDSGDGNENGNGDVNAKEKALDASAVKTEQNVVQPGSGSGLGENGVIGFIISDEGIMKRGLELLSGPKKAEMEEKWREQKVQELEHYLKKVEVIKEQALLVLDALKKSGRPVSH